MNTLSYGWKQPEDGDKGSVFWDALSDNVELTNDHNHNGTNSSRISASGLEAQAQTISSGSWVATSGGTYRQLVTVPSGYDAQNSMMQFRIDDDIIYPTVEPQSSTTYYIYINDNSLDITAYYFGA